MDIVLILSATCLLAVCCDGNQTKPTVISAVNGISQTTVAPRKVTTALLLETSNTAFQSKTSSDIVAKTTTSKPVGQTTFLATESTSKPVGQTTFLATESTSKPAGQTTFLATESTSKPVGQTTFLATESTSKAVGQTTFLATESTSKAVGQTTLLATESTSKAVSQTTFLATESTSKPVGQTTFLATESTSKPVSQTTFLATKSTSEPVIQTTLATKSTSETISLSTKSTSKPVNHTKSICYELVGCFSNAPPFDNAELVLPRSPAAIGTKFLLYTREGPPGNDTLFVEYTNISTLQQTNFSVNRPTKIVIHGFSNSIKTDWPYMIKDALLKREDCNVILVFWGPGAKFPDYPQAVANTRVVAKQVKMLIENMVVMGTTYENLHLIGHSLGAHTSGHVGQLFRKENITLGRITGLDPAEPDYKDHPNVVKLDKLDAHYVDVIHTNGAPFSKGGAGLFEPCGDVDFYVNGGETQPDCPSQVSGALSHLGDLFSGNIDALATVVSCSHSRAHEVFTESINADTCEFTAYPCDGYGKFQNGDCLSCGPQGCGVLGYDSNYYFATGMLFLNTRRSKPFCGHHYAVTLQVSGKTENTKGKVMVQLNGTWGVSEWLTVTRSDNAAFQHQDIKNRVVVARQIVGHIETINVKYVKYNGNFIGWGGGRKNLNLFQINILSGDSGRRYVFCLTDPLYTEKITTLISSDVTTCPDDL